jgi:hypothetical protein
MGIALPRVAVSRGGLAWQYFVDKVARMGEGGQMKENGKGGRNDE